MNKLFILLFVLTAAASSLLVAKPAFSAITKPSVPEFTVKFVDNSYDVSTYYSVDPYTGENVTHEGYHVLKRSIKLSIKNQNFTPYDSDGFTVNFYYNVRIKGYYSESFSELYNPSDGYLKQSNSEYTYLSIPAEDYPSNAKVDVQVQAMIGYCHRIQGTTDKGFSFPWVFTGETSGWSETKTITIENKGSTGNLDLSDQLTLIIAAALILVPVAAGLGLLIYLNRKK